MRYNAATSYHIATASLFATVPSVLVHGERSGAMYKGHAYVAAHDKGLWVLRFTRGAPLTNRVHLPLMMR